MTRRILNDQPFEHIGLNGTKFMAERCDFVGGLTAYVPKHLRPEQVAADMYALGAWHWANIVPDLNGFTGPPNIEIVLV